MKRKTLLFPILFIFLIVLTSCSSSNKMPDVNEYVLGTDFPYYYLSSNGEMRIAKSEQGYYILNGQYIYFMEEDGDEPILLDNRPNHECFETKDGENCDAYVEIETLNSILFQFYDGKLYFIEEIADYDDSSMFASYTYELVQLSPDGSKRKVIRTWNESTISEAAIHRGDLFYITEDWDKSDEFTHQIARLPLHKGKREPEILVSSNDINGGYTELIPYGTQLFFADWGNPNIYKDMRYDLTDGTVTELWEQTDEFEYPNMERMNMDKLYLWYFYDDLDETLTTELPELDPRSLIIYSSDLDGSNVTKTNIPSAKVFSKIYHDQRYTYVRPFWPYRDTMKDYDIPDEMKIYKNENELVHVVDTTRFAVSQDFVSGDERYMFIFEEDWEWVETEEDSYFTHKLFCLDKDEIETGKAEFKQLLENKTGNGDGIFDLNE